MKRTPLSGIQAFRLFEFKICNANARGYRLHCSVSIKVLLFLRQEEIMTAYNFVGNMNQTLTI